MAHEIKPEQIHPVQRPVDLIAGKVSEWRTARPELIKDKCTKCDQCTIFCPDNCFTHDEEGYPVIHYDYCKGCMVCVAVCPHDALDEIQERVEG